MCLGIVFFECILVGVCWASWICKLISFTTFGNFWHYFFKHFPSSYLLSLLLPVTHMLDLSVFSHRFLRLFTFFNLFSLYSSDWIISIDLSSSYLTLYFVISILLLSPFSEVFIFQILLFLRPKMSTQFFFRASSFLLRIYVPSCTSRMLSFISCNLFIMAALKCVYVYK